MNAVSESLEKIYNGEDESILDSHTQDELKDFILELFNKGRLNDYLKLEQTPVKNEDYAISAGWSVQDVLHEADDMMVIITSKEAKEILDWIDNKHDASIGINWSVIGIFIQKFLEKECREDFKYTRVVYDDNGYTSRLIVDPDNSEEMLIFAPEDLGELLKSKFGDDMQGCDLNQEVFFYASPEDLILPDADLLKLAL